MLRFKVLLIAAVYIWIVQRSNAQNHYNTWFRSTLSITLNSKFKIDAEFQHRRQNGFGNSDLLGKSLMYAFRSWVHYPYKEDLKFSFSPFAYFSNYRIIKSRSDEMIAPSSEFRFSAAAELQHKILDKFYLMDRIGIEYRVFASPQSNVTRLRNRFGLRYDFTNKIKAGIYDELLVNFTGIEEDHFFDQNRLGLGLEYKVLPSLKCDVGYMRIIRLPVTGTAKLYENNMYLNLTFILKQRNSKTKDST